MKYPQVRVLPHGFFFEFEHLENCGKRWRLESEVATLGRTSVSAMSRNPTMNSRVLLAVVATVLATATGQVYTPSVSTMGVAREPTPAGASCGQPDASHHTRFPTMSLMQPFYTQGSTVAP